MSFMAIISHVVIFTIETESAFYGRCIRPKNVLLEFFATLGKRTRPLHPKLLNVLSR